MLIVRHGSVTEGGSEIGHKKVIRGLAPSRKPLNPHSLISHLTNSNRCGNIWTRVPLTVSPFRPFLPPATPCVFATRRFCPSFVFILLRTAFPQPFCFEIHPHCPGCGGPLALTTQVLCFLSHPSNPCSFNRFRTLSASTGGGTPPSSHPKLLLRCFSNSVAAICALAIAYHECTSYVSEEFAAYGLGCDNTGTAPAAWAARASLDRHFLHGQPRFHAHAYALGARLRRHRFLPLHGFSDLRLVSPAARRTSFARQERQISKRHPHAREYGAVWQRTAHQR